MNLAATISLKDDFSTPLKKSMASMRMFESATTNLHSSMGAVTRAFSGVSTSSTALSRTLKTVSTATTAVSDDLRAVDATQAIDGAEIRYDSLGRKIRQIFTGVSAEARQMSSAMRSAFATQRVAMSGLRDEMIKSEFGFFTLAQASGQYAGTSKEFITQIESMGKAQKATTDKMVAANELGKASFFASVGAMLSRSSQASKISDNFERMGNPLYKLNAPLLSVADGLSRIAARGTPAALALKMLGPKANLKQLNDQVRLINQGLMGFTGVALIAGAAAVIFYSKLHKSALEASASYKTAFGSMADSVSKAFSPLVDTFAAVMTPIYSGITKIADAIVRFQTAHPLIAKIASAFMLIVPALTLILSPLAIGIGLMNGLAAALAAAAPLLMPIVTGFAAVLGTTVAVAAGITLLGTAFYLLYTRSEAFRSGVTAAWNGIKSAGMSVFNFLAPYVLQALTTVTSFVQSKLTLLQQFWQQNGVQIMTALTTVWNAISSIIKVGMAVITPILTVGFMLVKTLIIGTWDAIKNVISGALTVIMGVVQVFTGIFTGNFSTMWSGIKMIFTGAIQAIWGYVNLLFVGRILKAGAALFTGLKSTVSAGWTSIRNYFSNSIASIKSGVSNAWNAIKNFFTGGFNSAKATVSGGWNSIKSFFTNGISNAKNSVSTGFQNIVNTIADKIGSAKTKVMDWAKSLPSDLLSAFRGAMGQLSSIGSLVWDQIKTSLPSIGSIKDYVTGAVTGSGGGKGGGSKSSDGKHYSGAYNIPYNGYQATLHSGESVLTASQSATLRGAGILSSRNGNLPVVNASAGAGTASMGGPINRSVNVSVANMTVRQESDISRIASELAAMIETSDARNR